jgi:HAE1 family hydrophobic/amphiphilic exporter-1
VSNENLPRVSSEGMGGIARFSVTRRVTITMVILIIALFGVMSFFALGLDMFPDLELPLVTVVTRYQGVAPEDIENQITRPVESAVSTVKNVKLVYSASQEGLSSVVVEFEWGTNIDFAAQDVRDRLSLIAEYLPEEANAPLVLKFDTSQMPIVFAGVTGMEDTMVLRRYIEDVVAPRLERVDGVASAAVMGGLVREINIFLDADKLKAQSIAVEQVMGALVRENVNVSGGEVIKDGREHLLRTIGEYRSIGQIAATVVTTRDGTPVRVSDVSRVADTHSEVRHHGRIDGKNNVMLMLMKQSGANTSTVCRRVKEALDDLKSQMPKDVEVAILFDQGEFVDKVVDQTSRSALQGAALAVLFILLFLASWRPTLVIAITIPLSVLTTFIGMHFMGYTFNLLTLSGIALGIGMLVDNAIVVIENTFRHLEEGEGRAEAAINGAGEVGMAIVASTLTTVAVFVPMIWAGGLAGMLIKPVALVVCLSLGASLFIAVSLVPAMTATLLKAQNAAEFTKRFETGWFSRLRTAYRSALAVVLRHRKTVVIVIFVAIAAAGWGMGRIGTEYTTEADTPMVIAQISLPVGTPLEQTDRVVRTIEEWAASGTEVRHIAAMIGPSSDPHSGADAARGMGAADVNEAMVLVRLHDIGKGRTRRSPAIVEDLRSRLPKIEGAKYTFPNMGGGSMSISVDQTPIAVRVFGPEIDVLQRIGTQVAERLRKIDGLRDIQMSAEEGKPEVRIVLDRDRAAEQGLSVYQVASTAKTAVLGTVVSRFRVGGDEWDMRVRFDEKHRNSIEKIEDIEILSPTGVSVRLGDVADISYDVGPLRIARESQERKVTVSCSVVGRDIGMTVDEIRGALADVSLPEGYYIDYGGTYKDMISTFTSLFWALIAAAILIYMVMAAQFESLLQPFVIMFTVPLAFIGVVAGLAVFGMTLSMPAFMGMVILAGIVVNNGIIMIDYVNQLRQRGIEKHEAVLQGAATRLRPILITSITTILGILPMGLSTSEGSEMSAPMGIALASGLAFSTILTLFVIPVVYTIADRVSFKMAPDAHEARYGSGPG